MGEGQLWPVATQAAALFDPNNIGLKEFLQFATFLGSVYGAWKWWRFSKWQIAKRLIEYLDTEEKHIIEGRNAVLRHIRHGRPLVLEPGLKLHPTIDGALKESARDQPGRAEQQLIAFAATLTEDAKVGTRFMHNANRQAASVFVFIGLIARKKRSDTDAARTAWTNALQHNEADVEAIRCLAELDFEAHKDNDALKQLMVCTRLAPEDKLLRAETSQLRAEIFQRKSRPLLERNALHDGADSFVAVDENLRAANAYARAAEVELSRPLRMVNRAPTTLRKAYQNYHRAGDRSGAEEMRVKLVELGEDVSTLPAFDELARPIPWHWIRLAIEVCVLAAAAYLFLMAR